MNYNIFNLDIGKHVNYTTGLFLLLMAIAGNYVGETLSCQSQRLFKNIWIKHLTLFFIIYFSIVVTSNRNIHPTEEIKVSAIIWVIYHFFTKMNILPTSIVLLLFMAIFTMENYRKYYEKKQEQKKADKLKNTQTILYYLTFIVIAIGFISYFLKQKKYFKKNFSIKKFFIGTGVCRKI